MKKLVSIHSFRGGTGKSNITAGVASLVANAGHRVGVIDTDIHSPGIHVILGLPEDRVTLALNDYLWGKCRLEEAAYDVSAALGQVRDPGAGRAKLFLIPSSVQTGEIARVLREGYDVGLLNDGFRQLASALDLDYLFIDTPPGRERGDPALDRRVGPVPPGDAARSAGLPGDRRDGSSWPAGSTSATCRS